MNLSQAKNQDLPRRRRSPTSDEIKNFLALEDITFDDPLEAAHALKLMVEAIEKSDFLKHAEIDLDAVSDVAQALFSLALSLAEEAHDAEAKAARSGPRYE